MAEPLLIFFSIGGVCWQVFEAITTRLFFIPQYINTTGARVCLKDYMSLNMIPSRYNTWSYQLRRFYLEKHMVIRTH